MITRAGMAASAAAVVLVAAGGAAGYPELFAVGAAGAASVVLAAVLVLRVERLTVERHIEPDLVPEGGSARSSLLVRNPDGRRSPAVLVSETVGTAAASAVVPALRAGEPYRCVLELPTERRGAYPVPPVVIARADPFGLARRTRTVGAGSTLWVCPRTVPVAALPGRAAGDRGDATPVSALEAGQTFHALREYQDGDDLRLVHWPSTARRGRLIVRQNVEPPQIRHVVLLDTDARAYGEPAAFEDAVRFAASWCAASARAGCPVVLRTTSAEIAETGDPLRFLAGVTASSDGADLARTVALLPRDPAAAIGIVTGDAVGAPVPGTAGLRVRYLAVAVARIGARAHSAEPPPPGIRYVAGADLAAAAAGWDRLGPGPR